MQEAEKEAFATKLQEVEDWLYEDGEDETKGVYIAKLDELKKVWYCILLSFIGKQEPGFISTLFLDAAR